MKKSFSKPALKRFALNSKENIVSSITFDDEQLSSSWDFIHKVNNIEVDDPGCFGLLNRVFPTSPENFLGEYFWAEFYTQYLVYEKYLYEHDDSYNTEENRNNYYAYKGCSHNSISGQ